jgi:acetyl-CoA acetyltransferase
MVSLAALQARAYLEASGRTERDLAGVVARSRTAAATNPYALVTDAVTADDLLDEPATVSPLRAADCPPITDGAAAVVLAVGDTARRLCAQRGVRAAWIRGIDHRIEAHGLGARDLSRSVSTALAAERAGVAEGPVDVAELHAQFSHEELILREALGLDDTVTVNPSGGPLAVNPFMATGLIRMGEAAARVWDGTAGRAVAHATSGPCLQHNLVCVLEAAEPDRED